MIRPLRQRHRRIFAVLAVILPAAFAIGITARRPVPVAESLPAALEPKAVVFNYKIWSRDDLFAKAPVRAVLWREEENAGRFAIQFSLPAQLVKPDLLVYWSSDPAEVKGRIPDDAVLLGPVGNSGPLQLSGDFPSMNGTLILYSLADGEVVEVSKPVSLR